MKVTASELAASLGLRAVPFIHKKSGKEDAKRIVLKTELSMTGSTRLATFRKLTGLKPMVVKRSESRFIAIFPTAAFEKKQVELPIIKLG
jgi:hypothetical protein